MKWSVWNRPEKHEAGIPVSGAEQQEQEAGPLHTQLDASDEPCVSPRILKKKRLSKLVLLISGRIRADISLASPSNTQRSQPLELGVCSLGSFSLVSKHAQASILRTKKQPNLVFPERTQDGWWKVSTATLYYKCSAV